ncbi:MAG: hypothetical protein H0V70_04025 [Ktedonobacteraceae bacterium]|nr:hypothetical protein [Ktedonobacteraceae bacterium]
MQISKWARAFCTMDPQNGILKSHWVMGVLSAVRSDGTVELMSPIPFGPNGTLDVISPRPAPGPYICKEVMQIGDWVRAYCTIDAQNGKSRSRAAMGVLSAFRPDGTVELMSPITPPGPYICNQVLPAPDMPGPPVFVKEWRKRLGV